MKLPRNRSLGHIAALKDGRTILFRQVCRAVVRDDADARLHGTVREMVSERFKNEALHLHPLAQVRDDASYREQRFVYRDGYVNVRGNRYSVPDHLSGSTVEVCIGLRGELAVYAGEQVVPVSGCVPLPN
jgi:hypothetical protein